jgi:hypothetical protein
MNQGNDLYFLFEDESLKDMYALRVKTNGYILKEYFIAGTGGTATEVVGI